MTEGSAGSTVHAARPTSRRQAGWVVAASLSVAVAGMLPTYLVGALAVQIRQDFPLGATALGIATTAFFLASSIGSILLGRRVDRWGWQRAMTVASAAQVAVLCGLALFADGVAVVVAFLAVAGLIHSTSMPAGNLAIVRHVALRRQALVFGIRQSAVPGAVLLAGLAVPTIGLTVGWRWAFVLVLLGPAITMAALRSAPPVHPDETVRSGDARPSIRSPGLAAIVVAGMLGAVAVNTSGAFFVSSAVDGGMSEGAAGILLATGSVCAITMRVGVGHGVDRRASTGFVPMATLLGVGAVGFALLATREPALLAVGTPLAFGAGTGWAGLMHYILVSQHPHDPASASAAALAFGYAGGASGPVAFGALADWLGYGAAWTMVTACAVAAAILTLWSRRLFAAGTTRSP